MSQQQNVETTRSEVEVTNTLPLSQTDFNPQDLSLTTPLAKKRTVIVFYAPWCGHCQNFKQAYEMVAKMAKEGKLGDDVTIATVNGDNNKQLLQIMKNNPNAEYEVNGFPTTVSYNNGKYFSTYAPDTDPEKRKNFRSAEDLIDFVSGIGTAEVQYIKE